MQNLTAEQGQVIAHPLGSHARVLAVAGSGKSTTMAHRIKHLILDLNVLPAEINVLMFNSLACKQFIHHLDQVGLPQNLHPDVHTFHSLSFQIIHEAIKAHDLPPQTQFWLSDKTEYIWVTIKRGIADLEKAKKIPPDTIDPEQVMQAISLWKGSLTPPERAGSVSSAYLPIIYAQYEEFRQSQYALTYDDFVPQAIELLENNPPLYQRFCGRLHHLIVDEYQDVNLGQQTLIEMLAGDQADVMVVGDDDQTIYEWRGARPNYIIQDFTRVFNAKPVLDYQLSRSFRFGPLIAQCASNTISCNTIRVEKPLIAYQTEKSGFIQIYTDREATQELANQVQALMQNDREPPTEIVVLARMYAQLDNLEAEFLARGIPYRVDGQEPFFKRKEINSLLDYIRLEARWDEPMDDLAARWILSVANKPSRMLSRNLLEKMIQTARQKKISAKSTFEWAANDPSSGLSRWQIRPILELHDFIDRLRKKLDQPNAADVLEWMVQELDYLSYFQEYYGKGETADEKSNAVLHFIQLVRVMNLPPLSLLDQLSKLDTTQGKPEEEQILFTTIYRTKGLEFDYVLIPQCEENLMPYLRGKSIDIYDTRTVGRVSAMSNGLENERRLFYVALTRARIGVFIGASGSPSRFLQEIQLQPTQAIISLVEAVASGDEEAKTSLIATLQKEKYSQPLWKNLEEGYLPDLGQSKMAAEVAYLIQTALPMVEQIREGGIWAE
jgi:DNA helicase-2/ATP-dependent DNA helicase PcrA